MKRMPVVVIVKKNAETSLSLTNDEGDNWFEMEGKPSVAGIKYEIKGEMKWK